MSEIAPLPPRAPNAAETQPAAPARQPDARNENQTPSQQQGKGGDASTAKAAPSFKEPAISLSPRVAGIQVGDTLEGRVERIDAQQRAVVQNAKETLLIDPAAGLKTGGAAKVKVTQTVPQFLGQLVSQGAKPTPDIPVRLALVAVRGLDLTQQPAKAGDQPQQALKPATPNAQSPNSIADILRTSGRAAPQTLPATPQAAATAKPAAAVQSAAVQPPEARPTLLQSLVSRVETSAAIDSKATLAFIARHPGLSSAPKPLVMTLLPASAAQVTYAKVPATTSPLGQLLANGRALLATVQEGPAATTSAAARLPLAAGSLRIDVPTLPDTPLKAGEKVVLVSANAEPAAPKDGTAKAGATPQINAQTQSSEPKRIDTASIQWPALHNSLAATLSQTPTALPAALSARTAQLLTAVLGLNLSDAPEAAERLKQTLPLPAKNALKDSPDLQANLAKVSQGMKAVERLLQTQLDPLQQVLTTAQGARADAPAMPIIIPNSEASLIASLFHYPLSQEEAQSREGQDGKGGQQGQDKAFDVSLTFERFGRTRISGTFSGNDLALAVETQTAMPEALESELVTLFHDRCEACNYTGAIRFQRAD